MPKRSFSLRYGKGEISFEIPSDRLLYELEGRNRTPPEDLAAAYFRALDHPIDSPPLKELIKPGDRVVITVSDVTRRWQRNEDTLPLLIEVLNQVEYANKGTIIQLTRPENNELAAQAAVLPVNTMDEALKLAYEKCGTDTPKVTVMPQGANTFPIYNNG